MRYTFFPLPAVAFLVCWSCTTSSVTTKDRELIDKELRTDSTTVLVEVDQIPEPIGGIQAIMSKIRYPEEAQQNGVEGTVILLCTVDTNGDVTETKLIRGIGFGCDESAANAIRQTKFKPGRHQGRIVTTKATIPLRFRLRR